MNTITIAQASQRDAATLCLLGKTTFIETFAADNTEENMRRYLEAHFTEAQISTELSHPDTQFFIARESGQAVGYLKTNTGAAQTELQDDAALEIERIYVLRSHHGKKVGQLLYEKALEAALTTHKSYIWLGVWEHNPRAIRFYEKNGFVAFDKHVFRMGEEEQTDIMMKKVLA